MIRFSILFFALFLAMGCSQPMLTTLADTIYNSDGTLFNGTVVIQGPNLTAPGNVPILGISRTVFVKNGALSTPLVPNQTGSPSASTYSLVFSNGDVKTCNVPASGGPITLAAANCVDGTSQQSVPATVALSQIASGGATAGQPMCFFVPGGWGPGSCGIQPRLQQSFISGGSAGNYTPSNSAVFVKDSHGNELLRMWCSDWDFQDESFNVNNCYFGYQAGLSQPTDNISAGSLNSGFGAYSLWSITTGFDNAAFGFGALFGVSSGSDNTGIGYETMYVNSSGNENTAIGSYAMEGNMSGSNNVAIGYAAMYGNTSGTGNLAIGYGACEGQSTLMAVICLGNNASATDGITNSAAIGNGATVSASNRLVFGANTITDVYLGSEAPTATAHAFAFQSALATPSSSSAACTAGTIQWDASSIYICTATNTWKRATLATF